MYFLGMRPDPDNPGITVSCYHDDRVVCCFYGEIDDGQDNFAHRIAQIYQSGGIGSLAEIDGCYGMVLYDRMSKEVWLGGDAVGQRCLHYVLQDDLLLVSPHDIVLAATALVPAYVDPISFASIGLFGWSVGGASLLGAIRAVPPGGLVALRGDSPPRLLPHPLFVACDQRRGSVAEIRQIRERIIEAAQDYLARHLGHLPQILVELTGGFDSRAALAAATSVVDRDRLSSFSDGAPNSMDVRIGRKVAERIGIAHRGGLPPENSAEERRRYIEVMALETNGDANALLAMTNRIGLTPPRLCGDGGEIFRGYYYRFLEAEDRQPAIDAMIASVFWKKFNRLMIGMHPEVDRGIHNRVADRAAWLAGLALSQSDGLDLLYILERFAVWNQKVRRMTQALDRASPYYSRAAIRHFLTLPAPRGKQAQLHELLIQRHIPQTLSIPINDMYRLNLLLGNAFQRRLGKALILPERRIKGRIARHLPKSLSGPDLDQLRSQRLRHLFADKWAELIVADESGSMAAFTRPAAEKLLADARANEPAAVQAVGALITAEVFIRYAQRAYHH
jgi:asparagine synthetase B (glutamine-hydrolysing)